MSENVSELLLASIYSEYWKIKVLFVVPLFQRVIFGNCGCFIVIQGRYIFSSGSKLHRVRMIASCKGDNAFKISTC